MRRPIFLVSVALLALLILIMTLRSYERSAKCEDASFEGTAGINCR